jgi:hypothetical protein
LRSTCSSLTSPPPDRRPSLDRWAEHRELTGLVRRRASSGCAAHARSARGSNRSWAPRTEAPLSRKPGETVQRSHDADGVRRRSLRTGSFAPSVRHETSINVPYVLIGGGPRSRMLRASRSRSVARFTAGTSHPYVTILGRRPRSRGVGVGWMHRHAAPRRAGPRRWCRQGQTSDGQGVPA